ncbi:MAG: Tellurite resistance protein TerB [Pseudomonadota bacterium]|jgi:uncharacterized tellurite resistance protein B-like protein
MREIMSDLPELSDRAAITIAEAMRQMAHSDGAHPQEVALIEQFESSIDDQTAPSDLSAIDTPALKEALLKSLALVAFADGGLSEAERAVLEDYGRRLGVDAGDVGRAVSDVAVSLLSTFAGVHVFRDNVIKLGRSMGLDDKLIEETLDRAG